MHDLHEITRILGFVAIGLTVCVCLYKLGAFAIRALQRTCPPPPQAASMPVPDVEAQGHDSIIPFERKVRGSA